eukprot:scaffold8152_cov195-Amphora_coffeaeformis.AAC.4
MDLPQEFLRQPRTILSTQQHVKLYCATVVTSWSIEPIQLNIGFQLYHASIHLVENNLVLAYWNRNCVIVW